MAIIAPNTKGYSHMIFTKKKGSGHTPLTLTQITQMIGASFTVRASYTEGEFPGGPPSSIFTTQQNAEKLMSAGYEGFGLGEV